MSLRGSASLGGRSVSASALGSCGMGSGFSRRVRKPFAVLVAAMFCIALMESRAVWADESEASPDSIVEQSPTAEPRQDAETWRLWTALQRPVEGYKIDYRSRLLVNSDTSYEFGTDNPPPFNWAPLSRLEFPINSIWHGLQLAVEKPNWTLHFEWLTPMIQSIHGDLHDYDWMPPDGNDTDPWTPPDADYTDLGIADQRWITGHMMDLGLDIQLWDRMFGSPVGLWSTTGFRWQRFGVMAHDAFQVKSADVWLDEPLSYPGDVIAFDQQYYLTYVGGQLRAVLDHTVLPPVTLKFQADWANAQAYNVDHHLIREGDRYTMERTHGDSWHLGLTGEATIGRRIVVGSSVDYLQIRTKGRHHHLNEPMGEDWTWTNGVHAQSNQTWLTGFIGFRI